MKAEILERLSRETEQLKTQGLFKPERVLSSAQSAVVRVGAGAEVVNLCANNYLGLANDASVREAAQRALDRYGYGMASVRFICGTQEIHKDLEARLSRFLGTEDTILYSSCFDANGGLFETLLDEQDAVISDALNHASIIDGMRLCKAQRLRYANNDLDELEARLKEASKCSRAPDRDRRRVLDGRRDRAPQGHLRSGRPLRRAGDGGRLARDRLRRRARPRHARAARRHRAHRHPHRHARQGARRRERRLHLGPQGDHRLAAPALAAVPVLEQHSAVHRRGQPARARPARSGHDAARAPVGQRRALSLWHGGGRLRSRAGRASDHSGHARRCEGRLRVRAAPARRRRVRHRLLVSGRAAWQGAHSHADVGSAYARATRPRGRRVQQGRQGAADREVACTTLRALDARTYVKGPRAPPASTCRTSRNRCPARTTS